MVPEGASYVAYSWDAYKYGPVHCLGHLRWAQVLKSLCLLQVPGDMHQMGKYWAGPWVLRDSVVLRSLLYSLLSGCLPSWPCTAADMHPSTQVHGQDPTAAWTHPQNL